MIFYSLVLALALINLVLDCVISNLNAVFISFAHCVYKLYFTELDDNVEAYILPWNFHELATLLYSYIQCI